jgi:hypothetical protein
MRKTLSACCASLALLTGCASVEVADYRAERPVLDLRQYFNGDLNAWGMFQDRSGKVVKRFHVAMKASWQGEVGTLDEDFTYSDGTKQKRVWTLTRQPDGNYIGRADDVVGEARGEVAGNALRWRYVLALPVDGKVYHVNFDDWMFLIDDKVMLNRSFMSKFGIELGQVTLSFSKP